MMFKYDEQKSQTNQRKHGIDFVEAQRMWLDAQAVEIELRTRDGEERFQIIARLDDLIWSAIFTYRESKVRIISVRRARKEEVYFYENRKRTG